MIFIKTNEASNLKYYFRYELAPEAIFNQDETGDIVNTPIDVLAQRGNNWQIKAQEIYTYLPHKVHLLLRHLKH